MRVIGWILGDLATALIGTAVLESELERIFRAHSVAALGAREYILSVVVALVLGYVAYTLRPHESAKWV